MAVSLLVGSMALAACAGPGREVDGDDVARIEQSLTNGSELAWELVQAEARVAARCMEDAGFEVHHPFLLHGSMYPDRFEGFASPYSRIPTVEQAEKFAFGQWVFHTETPAAEAMRTDPDYLAFVADDMGWSDPAEDTVYQEWQAQDQEYRDAWEEAFYGPERFAYNQAMNEAFEADPDAEFDPGPQPPFGGCELETLEIVYDGPGHRETDGEDVWHRPLPETPLTWVGDGTVYEELSAQYADQEQDFLFCVQDLGYGEWEFDSLGWLPAAFYLQQLYDPVPDGEGGPEIPPLNDEAEDADDPQAYEFAMALDFAQCAETSGLRDGSEEAWAELYVAQLIDRETEIYAWEQQIKDYLANAQDHIAGP
ncbi:hypothetical protein [Glycomyces dulcitolivorans]|uniref:hypothetical protein n=1 Tax=Glycomyces dulcitolivorans TaxID=2200759 RepID=UPI000DD36777|nr:hypothetical protein [Glycomyces dulcitolivorans]